MQSNTSYAPLNPRDLQDPSLTRLNSKISWIWNRISLFVLGSNSTSMSVQVPFSAPNFTATAAPAGSINLPPTQVLTKGQADILYGAQAISQAFQSGSYNNQPVQLPVSPQVASVVNQSGIHSQRAAVAPVLGTTFWESDRTVLYEAVNGTSALVWRYITGIMSAPFASLPNDLGASDAGFLFFDNTNSLHVWKWTGAGWAWGPGNDRPSGEIAFFTANPGTGWHLADGSAGITVYSAAAGSAVITLPNTLTFYLRMNSPYTGTGNVANAPTITAPGTTGASVTGDSVSTTSGSVNAGGGAPSTFLTSASLVDPTHSHSIGSITAGTDGTPPTFDLLPYYRL